MNEARFNPRFDEWADSYDSVVAGRDPQYREVFAGYREILTRSVLALGLPPGSRVLEIGVGTANLTQLLRETGYRVTGVEPSGEMRRIARGKLPDLDLRDGHFLQLPAEETYDGMISTYAFHHLTEKEKGEALTGIRHLLRPGGRIVITDTAFLDTTSKRKIRLEAFEQGFDKVVRDLDEEFFPLLSEVGELFRCAGMAVEFEQLNRYVWLMKGEDVDR
ncbi:class I SAM-dependent methyltransferase [Salinithrix halophila]|uniref:Class I SAM-dependent methyltransferase n=1 Tax=Salinithrix halophila TaxID=1485204 RepID=A0ABV8JEY2_9BACL